MAPQTEQLISALYSVKLGVQQIIDILQQDEKPYICNYSADVVAKVTFEKLADYIKVRIIDMIGKSRKRPLPDTRKIFCFVMKQMLGNKISHQAIGDYLDYSHSDVTQNLKKMEDARTINDKLYFEAISILQLVKTELK